VNNPTRESSHAYRAENRPVPVVRQHKFGVSWQIVPRVIVAMMTNADRAKPERVMNALLKKKLDIAALERAFAG
jgi:predicted 3-demethylubiquinone-9 3-methyltransferase (glyoxalase superfamily)